MRLTELQEKVRQRFLEEPEYVDGGETHAQTLMTAATHEVDGVVSTVGVAGELLKELDQHEPELNWDEVEQLIVGWPGVMDSLQDIITAAIIAVLLQDSTIAAEETLRQARKK